MAVFVAATVGSGDGNRVQQHMGVVVRRRLVELVGRRDLAELAEVHHRDAIADVLDDGQIVGNEDQRQPVLRLQVLEQVQHLGLHADVEALTGSSQMISVGSSTSERAMEMRWHWPPLN